LPKRDIIPERTQKTQRKRRGKKEREILEERGGDVLLGEAKASSFPKGGWT